uniref:autotransporter domain-containing protein n=1 Tax=Inquilinus sp. TaxID=1932117 RepID=UPI0031D3348F
GSASGGKAHVQDISITKYVDGCSNALLQACATGARIEKATLYVTNATGEQTDFLTIELSEGVLVTSCSTGGSGGEGGAVNATTAGAISTVGGDADGVMLQSIGGGGGLGGSIGADASSHPILDRIGEFKDNKDRLSDEGNTYTLTVDVGGKGGGGGDGGTVSLDHKGKIATSGDWADGIVAQSIGGGGGAGGSATASGSKVRANITVGVGGHGGTAGNGGTINVTLDDSHDNEVNTQGYAAHAVVLQSIGGGGGQGGDGSDQASGNITVGGDAGGTAGAGGDGGTIQSPTPGNWLNLSTRGDDAIGILAQSIGGGGGTGGAGNSSAAKNVGGHAVAVVVGGQGGVSGNGGTVSLTTGLGLTTYGARSYGVVAQSIGGGGGIGGAGNANNLTGVALGGQGGAGGYGGAVTLDITTASRIATNGAGAHAIVAQSIGGGGGIAGDASVGILSTSPVTRNSDTTSGGNGGAVSVTTEGSITTTGANAFGILAQSIAGGGGFGGDQAGGFAGNTSFGKAGNGGTVTVTQNGSINTTGTNSVGIFAQSQGPDDNGAVDVTINGAVAGGSGAGSGVWISAGKNNLLTVNAGGSVSAASGTAIRFDGDWDTANGSVLTVDNYGTISGNILLSNTDTSCTGTVDNAPGCAAGTVNNYSSDTLVDASLYQANVVNQGRLVVGHSGKTDGIEITGNFTQGAAGTLVVDTDFNSFAADRLLVRGDAALGGTLDLQATSLRPGRALTVLTVDGTATGAITPETSPIYRFALTPDGHDTRLSVASADFDPAAMKLEDNQSKVAGHLQAIWDAGGTDSFGRLFATLGSAADQGRRAYSGMLSDLSPGVALAPAAQLQAGLARFNTGLMSCPVFGGGDALTSETDCAWAQVTGRSTQQTADGGIGGFSNDSVTYQVGGQHEVAPGWFVGLSGAYQQSWLDGYDDRVDGDGSSGFLGLTVKREMGPWLVAGALSGSYGSFSLDRRISIPGFSGTASSDPDVFAGAARLRAARTFAFSELYLKPMIDLDAIYSRMPGYREGGGGDLGLKV